MVLCIHQIRGTKTQGKSGDCGEQCVVRFIKVLKSRMRDPASRLSMSELSS